MGKNHLFGEIAKLNAANYACETIILCADGKFLAVNVDARLFVAFEDARVEPFVEGLAGNGIFVFSFGELETNEVEFVSFDKRRALRSGNNIVGRTYAGGNIACFCCEVH